MNQLTRGQQRRVMYVENKSGAMDGVAGRIGWVTFSRSGFTVYYRGRTLQRLRGRGVSGNHFDVDTKEEYWVSGIKKNGQDAHWASRIKVEVDQDAVDEYNRLLHEGATKQENARSSSNASTKMTATTPCEQLRTATLPA